METKLKAEVRGQTGKSAARKARSCGELPAVMYGMGNEPTPLTVRQEDVRKLLSGGLGSNILIDLEVDHGGKSESHLVLIKDVQRHPIKDRLLHIDFLKVARDEKVTVKVPVALRGEEQSVGLKAGGTLQHNLWEVEVECLPMDVPDHLYADVTLIDVGGHLSVSDLEAPAGVRILTEPEDVILTILAPRIAVEKVPEEEAEVKEEVPAEEETAGADQAPQRKPGD